MDRRHSEAETPSLVTDEAERAELEARNGLKQYDVAKKLIEQGIDPERPFKLRVSLIQQLHAVALDKLSSYAGNWRPDSVKISGSQHQPVDRHLVSGLVEELCDYVNENWDNQSAIHLAAYVLWRLNWIHPFDDGNGRTSRMVSYLVLCIRLGSLLPGANTIPDQISANKDPYYRALEAADEACRDGRVDVSDLEQLLKACLANQLLEVVEKADGNHTA